MTDIALGLYLVILSALILVFPRPGIDPAYHLGANLLVAGLILMLAGLDHRFGRAWRPLHVFYPIVLMIWLYPQACELRFLFWDHEFDAFLVWAERLIFTTELYRTMAHWPVWILESLNGVYFLYYSALVLLAVPAWKKQPDLVKAYVFTFTLNELVHHFLIIGFPASGPAYLRDSLYPDGVLFIPLMNWIYAAADQGGGAFPSLHSASTVIMALFAVRFHPRYRWAILTFTVLIFISTVAGSFHYAVDTIAGILSGCLGYAAGTWLFARLKSS